VTQAYASIRRRILDNVYRTITTTSVLSLASTVLLGVVGAAVMYVGAREILAGTRAGILCERNSTAIATAIERLRADPPDRARVSAATDRFDWGACVGRLHTLFHGLIEHEAAA